MKKNYVLSFLFCLSAAWLSAQVYLDAATLKKHIEWLSADSLMGRGTGTDAERKAAAYIADHFQKLGLAPKGPEGSWYQDFDFTVSSHGVSGRKGIARNVLAYLDNGSAYTVVIGGHYDHLGLGEDGGSLDAHAHGEVHNGADDNASGTAGVMALASLFAGNNEKEAFNFLFICFSGEELGLFGSRNFCDKPTIDLKTVQCMINMDMIGRLSTTKPALTVSGAGTAPEFVSLLNNYRSAALDIVIDSAGVGPSDHTSFYNKEVPALHFFTGTHADYHKPSDDADKINIQGTEAVLSLIADFIYRLPADRRLSFLKTRNPSTGSAPSFKVTLGIMPSYASAGEGLKVEAVLDGKPGKKAGLQDGDVITAIGDYKVTEIQTYMEALSKFKKGDTATLHVKRGKKKKKLKVEF